MSLPLGRAPTEGGAEPLLHKLGNGEGVKIWVARGEEEEDWDPALEVLCVAVGVVAAEGVDTPRERVLTAEEEGEDKMEAVL